MVVLEGVSGCQLEGWVTTEPHVSHHPSSCPGLVRTVAQASKSNTRQQVPMGNTFKVSAAPILLLSHQLTRITWPTLEWMWKGPANALGVGGWNDLGAVTAKSAISPLNSGKFLIALFQVFSLHLHLLFLLESPHTQMLTSLLSSMSLSLDFYSFNCFHLFENLLGEFLIWSFISFVHFRCYTHSASKWPTELLVLSTVVFTPGIFSQFFFVPISCFQYLPLGY